MKKVSVVFLLFIIMIISAPSVSAADKYLKSEGESTEIVLDYDGNAHIKEERSYYFGGDTITRCQRHYKSNNYIMSNFQVYFDDEPMIMLDDPDDSRPEGYAAAYYDMDGYHVDVYMSCLNESHTFTIEYDVYDAVILHDDSTEFRWNISSSNEPVKTSSLTADIILPSDIDSNDITINTSGFSHGYSLLPSSDNISHVTLSQKNLSKDKAAAVQLLMPKDLFSGSLRYESSIGSIKGNDFTGSKSVSEIVSEIFAAYIIIWFISFAVLKIVDITVTGKRKLQECRCTPEQSPESYSGIPDNLHPAMVARLCSTYAGYDGDIYSSASGNKSAAFASTLLDLADRGVISVTNDNDTVMIGLNDYYTKISGFEKPVVDLLAKALKGKEKISDKKLKKYLSNHSNIVNENLTEFQREIKTEYDKYNFEIKVTPEKHTLVKFLLFAVLSVILSVVFFKCVFSNQNPVISFLSGIVSSGFITFTILLDAHAVIHERTVLTQEGENRLALWKAFGKFLDDSINTKTPVFSDPVLLRKSIIYSAALGRKDALTKRLDDNLSNMDTDIYNYSDFSSYLSLSNIVNDISFTSDTFDSSSSDFSSSCFDSSGSCDSGSSGGSFD